MDRFWVACCVFSFITGSYLTVLHEKDRGCTIEVKKGFETTVTIGKKDD